jgi:riboflavin synthase
MFNGIIEFTGRITDLQPHHSGARINIDAGKLASRMKTGDSIAVDGVCLTVVRKKQRGLWFDVSAETWSRTNLAHQAKGNLVNLEPPMTADTFLSGHLVQGHVEGTGRVEKWIRRDGDVRLFISLPRELVRFCISKGSIAVNGVSLTIASQKGQLIGIALIPYTLKHTNLDTLKIGDLVNIETDIIGRYVVSALKKEYPNI